MEKEKKLISNTMYTIGGALLMNGVLQLIIYPLLNRHMGAQQLGVLLYITGLVSILCPSVGQALNTSRLVLRRTAQVTNGDYNLLLLMFGGVGSILCLAFSGDSLSFAGGGLLAVLLFMTTIFRYYGDVEYRLNLNYRRYFLYYAAASAGYLGGYGLYMLTGSWFLIFLSGEILALAYLGYTGTVFHQFFAKSKYFSTAALRGGFLVFSYLITNTTLNMDRVVLKYLMGSTQVTEYYVTSLIGKTMVLLVAPINTIMISYLTKQKEVMKGRTYLKFVGWGLGVSAFFFLLAQIGTPLFVKLFYPDLYQSVKEIITVVNATQILGLLSAYLFILVLTFTEEKWQLILQVGHLVLMTVLVLIFTGNHGIMGFAAAALLANIMRVAGVIGLGLWKVKRR